MDKSTEELLKEIELLKKEIERQQKQNNKLANALNACLSVIRAVAE